jgi:serine protease Do
MMKTNDLKKVLGILLIVLAIVSISFSVFSKVEKDNKRTTTYFRDQMQQGKPVNMTSGSGNNTGGYPDFVEAAAKSVHAVVHIRSSYLQKSNYYDQFYSNNPYFDFFFGQPQRPRQEQVQTYGSGVIISSDGYIVTNNHVVQDADTIIVTLNDKRAFTAQLIGNDPTTDLAVIKINAKELVYLSYGNSDNLKVGEWVLAVGNPYNLTSTVTSGIVSAKARDINILGGNNTIESFIQTDAPVNPGNSGGALVNTSGELIGVNAAIASNTGSFTGYAFAIPVNIVKKVVDDIMKYGIIQRAYLGIRMQEVTSKLAEKKGLDNLQGVYVNSVVPKSGADDSGIKQGDIITNIGGINVNSSTQIMEVIGEHRPGDKIDVNLNRDGKNMMVSVTLKNEDGTTKIINKEEAKTSLSILGGTFEAITNDDMRRLGIDHGLKVKKLENGKLKGAGIKEGFIITAIDHKPINTIDDLKNVLGNKKDGMLIEGVYPNGLRYFYGFGM